MARAGFCSRCQANVWLLEDGTCQNGHPASSVSGVYESEPPQASAPEAANQPARPKSRRFLVVGIGVLVLVALGLCGLVGSVIRPLIGTGASVASQWQNRLAKDYPGWKAVGFNTRSFSGSGGSETRYSFTLIPPDREFSVAVVYVSKDGRPAASQDEVFRPAGKFNDRSDALLDFIDENYVKQHRSVASVTSTPDGSATVDWVRVRRVGPFSSRVGSFDELTYDEATGQWEVSGGPDN